MRPLIFTWADGLGARIEGIHFANRLGGRPLVEKLGTVAGFSPVDVSISATGAVSYGRGSSAHRVMRFELRNQAQFPATFTRLRAELLARFSMVRR